MKSNLTWSDSEIVWTVMTSYQLGREMILLRRHVGESILFELDLAKHQVYGFIDLANLWDLWSLAQPDPDWLSFGRYLEANGFLESYDMLYLFEDGKSHNEFKPNFIQRLLCDLKGISNE